MATTAVKSFRLDNNDDEKFVFVSYSHDDYNRVQADLRYLVEERQIQVFYDEGNFGAGEDWWEKVANHVNHPNCRAAIFYISRKSVRSAAILREVQICTAKVLRERDFKIIPVIMEPRFILPQNIAAIGLLEDNKYPSSSKSDSNITNFDIIYKAYCQLFPVDIVADLYGNTEEEQRSRRIEMCNRSLQEISNEQLYDYRPVTDNAKRNQAQNIVLTRYNGVATHLTIPNTYKGYLVTGLDSRMFDLREEGRTNPEVCRKLESVVIAEGIKTIGEGCFRNCTKLSAVKLPESIEHIEYEAFRECTSLSEIKIGEHIVEIGDYCFYKCHNLKRVHFSPNGDKAELGFNCFQDCFALTDVILPLEVKSMSRYCFNMCKNLKELRLPKLESEYPTVVMNCRSLTKLELSVDYPPKGDTPLYIDCPVAEIVAPNVIAPAEVKPTIKLKTPTIEIDLENSGLKIVNIPQECIAIELRLRSISSIDDANGAAPTIPVTIPILGKNTPTDKLVESLGLKLEICAKRNLVIVKCEKSDETRYRPFFASVVAKGSKNHADSDPSDEKLVCTNDMRFVLDKNGRRLKRYHDVYNPLGSKNKKWEVEVPDDVDEIADGAFADCRNITFVKLSPNLKKIGNKAFYHCKNLATIDWNGAPVAEIGERAFAYSGLTGNISLPVTLETMGDRAFQVCDKLTAINMLNCEKIKVLPKECFRRCIALNGFLFPLGLQQLEYGVFRGCTDLRPDLDGCNLNQCNDLEYIGHACFSYMMYTPVLNLPTKAANLKVEGNPVFYSYLVEKIEPTTDGLLYSRDGSDLLACPDDYQKTTIAIDPETKCIGQQALYDVRNVESVTMADGTLSAIGKENFFQCSKLTNIQLRLSKEARLGSHTFYHNQNLKHVEFVFPDVDFATMRTYDGVIDISGLILFGNECLKDNDAMTELLFIDCKDMTISVDVKRRIYSYIEPIRDGKNANRLIELEYTVRDSSISDRDLEGAAMKYYTFGRK